ncbi:hypothetical protein BBF96_00670 [Anoxybacter fermentans]|uniref:SGNH hydrolase-type esterase domain-containing protein n=1 Tax=Anoxybacter fermentans TaxID=1323375 RepID=A0A3Q9HNR6_9FIRM|nr:SGNH/GDSL hydrolase family protein [Anoxybacter fermentans]AZR72035.1 hypothetical protein BBF96_00670 [Anoxybacter fermentans]
MRIFCLGDSLTRGYGVMADKSFPIQLKEILKKRGITVEVYNLGIDGQTSMELKNRFLDQLSDAKKGDLVFLLIGTNDTLGLRLAVDHYINNLREMVNLILIKGLKLCIATLPPVEINYFYGEDPGHRIRKYNAEIRKLAQQKQLPLVELSDIDVNLTIDGVHFGEKGYKEIAERWAKQVIFLASKASG